MEMQKYHDNYEEVVGSGSELTEKIADRWNNTVVLEANTSAITVWKGSLSDDKASINLARIHGETLHRKTIKAEHMNPALEHTATHEKGMCGTQLFLCVEGKGPMRFIGISAAAKISLTGRSGVSFRGEMNDFDFTIPPIHLAGMLEATIKANAKKVKVICVYNKVIGIMSERYSVVPQTELIENVHAVLKERHQNTELTGGYVSNRTTTIHFDLHEIVAVKGQEYALLISVGDSTNGYRAVSLIPCCQRLNSAGKRSTNVYRFDDDEWNCNHVGLDMSRIIEGADTMLLKLRDNVALMAEAETHILAYPALYFSHAVSQLNRLAVNKGGTKISKSMEKEISEMILTLISQGVKREFSVMDIADYLLNAIPYEVADSTRDSMKKTIMRIINLKHDELDKQ